MKSKRYQRIQAGIRKYQLNGKYYTNKRIQGKDYYDNFTSLRDAQKWVREWSPNLKNNASDSLLFSDIVKSYRSHEYPRLQESTIATKETSLSVFYDELAELRLDQISSKLISELVSKAKDKAIKQNSTRFNFDKPLKELKVIFNWYLEYEDENDNFVIPIKKKHFSLGIIKQKEKKEKNLSSEELLAFFDSIDDPVFRRFSIIQFFSACRVCETAGLLIENVDFHKNILTIQNSISWKRRKDMEVKLKSRTKTNETRHIPIEGSMFQNALQEQLKASNGRLLFHNKDGSPFTYKQIQWRYNKALKKAGLFPRFSSTHIMRHTSATIARDVTKSLDGAQAVTGHKSQKACEVYAKQSSRLHRDTLSEMAKLLN